MCPLKRISLQRILDGGGRTRRGPQVPGPGLDTGHVQSSSTVPPPRVSSAPLAHRHQTWVYGPHAIPTGTGPHPTTSVTRPRGTASWGVCSGLGRSASWDANVAAVALAYGQLGVPLLDAWTGPPPRAVVPSHRSSHRAALRRSVENLARRTWGLMVVMMGGERSNIMIMIVPCARPHGNQHAPHQRLHGKV